MKCPKCGREIADDALFCEFCFADIRIVPTYEAQLEQQLSETMADISSQLQEDDEPEPYRDPADVPPDSQDGYGTARHAYEPLYRTPYLAARDLDISVRRTLAFVLLTAIALISAIIGYSIKRNEELNSPSYYVGRAFEAATQGNYQKAADQIQYAISHTDTGSAHLMLQKAEYLQKAGKPEDAIAAAQQVVQSPDSPEEAVIAAYGRMISIYSSSGDYARISDILLNSNDPGVQEAYKDYMRYSPVFDPEPGYYDKEISLVIKAQGTGAIFYTVDGTVPTTESMLYENPITLIKGRYRIMAICVNHFGIASAPVTAVYQIEY